MLEGFDWYKQMLAAEMEDRVERRVPLKDMRFCQCRGGKLTEALREHYRIGDALTLITQASRNRSMENYDPVASATGYNETRAGKTARSEL